jgi:hypothetical protein
MCTSGPENDGNRRNRPESKWRRERERKGNGIEQQGREREWVEGAVSPICFDHHGILILFGLAQ